ncbi:MAG: hypothetical protein R3D71_07680 [Rickettsiales bacterium]
MEEHQEHSGGEDGRASKGFGINLGSIFGGIGGLLGGSLLFRNSQQNGWLKTIGITVLAVIGAILGNRTLGFSKREEEVAEGAGEGADGSKGREHEKEKEKSGKKIKFDDKGEATLLFNVDNKITTNIVLNTMLVKVNDKGKVLGVAVTGSDGNFAGDENHEILFTEVPDSFRKLPMRNGGIDVKSAEKQLQDLRKLAEVDRDNRQKAKNDVTGSLGEEKVNLGFQDVGGDHVPVPVNVSVANSKNTARTVV